MKYCCNACASALPEPKPKKQTPFSAQTLQYRSTLRVPPIPLCFSQLWRKRLKYPFMIAVEPLFLRSIQHVNIDELLTYGIQREVLKAQKVFRIVITAVLDS